MASEERSFSPKGIEQLIFPNNSKEMRLSAQLTAASLKQDPSLIAPFILYRENALLAARAGGRDELVLVLNGFTSRVNAETRQGWGDQVDLSLSVKSARALLAYLPPATDKKRSEQTQIIENLLRGVINDRFLPTYDWRGSVRTQRIVLEGVVEPIPDVGLMSKWLDLYTGKYRYIYQPYHSLAWRAQIHASRIASVKDEEFLYVANEIGTAAATVAELLGRRDEMIRVQKQVLNYTAFSDYARGVYQMGLDPSRGSGSKILKRGLTDLKAKPSLHIPPYLRPFLDPEIAASLTLTPDTAEVAEIGAQNFERAAQIDEVATTFGQRQLKKIGLLDDSNLGIETSHMNPDGSVTFPHNIYLRRQPLCDPIFLLFEDSHIRRELRNFVEKVRQEKGESWVEIPIAQAGFYGILLIDGEVPSSPAQRIEFINEFLESQNVPYSYEKAKAVTSPYAPIVFGLNNFRLILVPRKEQATKSEFESLLDLKLSDEKRAESDETLRKNEELRLGIPNRFTRMPTRVGDRYDLQDHEDMPNTIQRAFIEKGPDGGLLFRLVFISDPTIYPDGYTPVITGNINFSDLRVNIIYGEDTPSMASDQRALIDSALLHLVERSCCPTLREVEEEVGHSEREVGILEPPRSVPGAIVHVGGFRSDGNRKQFTPEAARNYLWVVDSLYGDTEGISLARVNSWHQETHLAERTIDDRFVTYQRGRDIEIAEEPTLRSNPQHLN